MKEERKSWFWIQSFNTTKCVLFQEYLRQQQQLVCILCLVHCLYLARIFGTMLQPSMASWSFLK